MYNCKSRTFHMHYAGYPEGVGMCKCRSESFGDGVSYVYAAYTFNLVDGVCCEIPANLVEVSRRADGDEFEFTIVTRDTALIDEIAKEAFNLHSFTTYMQTVHPRRSNGNDKNNSERDIADDDADTVDLSAVRMSLM